MFSYLTLEQRVPSDHPLREIRALTDGVLQSLDAEFDKLYAATGRASIAPEYMLHALLLQAFYSIRSERQLVEQLDYNLLFRWFVGLGMDDAVWNHAVFSKNRDRLLNSEVAQQFFAAVNQQAKRFMSDDHFTVDGTLIQAWASHKSFRAKDGSDDDGGDGANFHGQKRSNDTHESTTDPDARLYKKSYGKESHLAYRWTHAGGEPQRPDRRRHDPGRRLRRARGRAADARGQAKRPQASHHRRRGQGLRHQGFHRGHTRLERHRACDQERQGTPLQPGPQNRGIPATPSA
jgi:transposase